jgi:hypothetical protein
MVDRHEGLLLWGRRTSAQPVLDLQVHRLRRVLAALLADEAGEIQVDAGFIVVDRPLTGAVAERGAR